MVIMLKNSSKYIVYISGSLIFFCAGLTVIEVILRKFFHFSIGGVDEISSYIFAIVISWSLAYVLFEKMHIRIDIFYNFLENRWKYFLDFFSMLINFIFISSITYFSFNVFYNSWEKNSYANTPLGTPLWIPQGFWFIGFVFFLIVITTLLYKCMQNLFQKEKNNLSDIKKEIEC